MQTHFRFVHCDIFQQLFFPPLFRRLGNNLFPRQRLSIMIIMSSHMRILSLIVWLELLLVQVNASVLSYRRFQKGLMLGYILGSKKPDGGYEASASPGEYESSSMDRIAQRISLAPPHYTPQGMADVSTTVAPSSIIARFYPLTSLLGTGIAPQDTSSSSYYSVPASETTLMSVSCFPYSPVSIL